jgi:hypothetical protein
MIIVSFHDDDDYNDDDEYDDDNVASEQESEMILNALNNNYSLVDQRNTFLRWVSFDFAMFEIAVGAVFTRNQVCIS